ncbi:tRNA (N(6)-L-threonylcarbamoyladenosine(37)-C(2))-methylthiotransferase MtaB [Albimonas sp. CAU 1670]|uniref:tRNA (N(6)-L-threonylcarbamoyladenosine(37)-C(2))- methylthiotransferase MtaB n=1 Tax=Albimonas sp. CAU 1670 TaxID=3032599 RepID=UPI0023DAF94C|nr:tRNA (N(6)-L-threonylcarbamoyladenosine(37)-C(2))-methylthiotransferase MtaB [Albimonas sp. CAU 1670]MDF2235405.1 tRNA (N(6)-L-threonylcarbamoyladenosine(37)-C(2))-methylthiotransferase MtaB [Albimonas sp. CAU 1670]
MAQDRPAPPVFETFGCRLNAYETEAMKALAAEQGLGDAVVVNTCAVTAEAVRQARQRIRKLRRENPGARLIVTGCAAQTEPETFASMPEVDLVLGNAEKMQAPAWARLKAEEKLGSNGGPDLIGDTEKIRVDDIMSATETAGHLIDGFGTRARAYVQVQNGCDHRCTFCIIPYGRGNSRSVPAGVVVEQIRRLVAQGYNEVVLTGVDLTSWGADLPGKPPLGDLVQRILRLVPDLPRLRISSIDSVEADPALVDAVGSDARLMPHLHLSLQAGDDMILKRMKRRHLRDDAIRFCEDIRKARPDIVFGADLIAGFPTETEEMFLNSLKLVEECGLTWLHVFPYSPRKGTPAARMPQVAKSVGKARAARLRAVGEAARDAWLDGRVGATERLVMETETRGRSEGFAEVILPRPAAPGELLEVRVAARDGERLIAA